jgi:hypothetical protein
MQDSEISNDIKNKFRTIQCIQFPESVNQRDIAIYLARIHVTGNKRWRAFNQAALIFDLTEKYNMSLEEIRSSLSMGKQTVVTTIRAYNNLLDYSKKYSHLNSDWTEKYSYFLEFYKSNKLKEWSTLPENQEKFKQWIATGKFEKGEQVRHIWEIIFNSNAFKIFDSPQGNFGKAMEIVARDDPIRGSTLYKMVNRLTNNLIKNSSSEILAISKSKEKLRCLNDLKNIIETILNNSEKLK